MPNLRGTGLILGDPSVKKFRLLQNEKTTIRHNSDTTVFKLGAVLDETSASQEVFEPHIIDQVCCRLAGDYLTDAQDMSGRVFNFTIGPRRFQFKSGPERIECTGNMKMRSYQIVSCIRLDGDLHDDYEQCRNDPDILDLYHSVIVTFNWFNPTGIVDYFSLGRRLLDPVLEEVDPMRYPKVAVGDIYKELAQTFFNTKEMSCLIDRLQKQKKQLILTGFSLGGSISLVTSLLMHIQLDKRRRLTPVMPGNSTESSKSEAHKEDSHRIRVVTFGAPRTGNASFTHLCKEILHRDSACYIMTCSQVGNAVEPMNPSPNHSSEVVHSAIDENNLCKVDGANDRARSTPLDARQLIDHEHQLTDLEVMCLSGGFGHDNQTGCNGMNPAHMLATAACSATTDEWAYPASYLGAHDSNVSLSCLGINTSSPPASHNIQVPLIYDPVCISQPSRRQVNVLPSRSSDKELLKGIVTNYTDSNPFSRLFIRDIGKYRFVDDDDIAIWKGMEETGEYSIQDQTVMRTVLNFVSRRSPFSESYDRAFNELHSIAVYYSALLGIDATKAANALC